MAVEVGTAYVSIWPKMDGSTWANSINSALGGVNTDTGGKNIGKSLANSVASGLSVGKIAIGNMIANVASSGLSAIRNSLDSAISRVDSLNQFPKVMKNLGFSTDEASASISKMSSGIEGLPTTLDGIVKNTQAFALTLGDLGKATDVAIAVNDGMLAFGASSEGASEAVRQLNQMITTSKYDMQSWNSINSAAPGLLDTVARSMLGASSNAVELRDALNNGEISTEDFLASLIKLDTEGADGITSFAETARTATGGIGTSMQNIKSAITKNLANIIDKFNGSGGITKVLDGFKGAINGVGNVLLPFASIAGEVFSGIADKAAGMLSSFAERTGAFKTAFETAFADTGNIVQSFAEGLKSAFDGTALQGVFDGLSGAVSSFFDTLDNGGSKMEAFKSLVSEMPPPITAVGAAVATVAGASGFSTIQSKVAAMASSFTKLGPAVTGFVSNASKLPVVGGMFTALGGKLNTLGSAVTLCGGGFKGFASVLGGVLTGPIGIVVGLLAGLAAAFVYLWNTSEPFKQQLTALGEQLMTSLQPCLQQIGTLLQNLAAAVFPVITSLITALAPILTQIVTIIANLAMAVQVATQILAIVVPVIEQIAALIQEAMPVIQEIITTAMTAIQAVIEAVWPAIQIIIETVMGVIQGVIDTVMALIQGDWDGVWNGIKEIAQSVWDGIHGIVDWAINGISDLIGSVIDGIRSNWETVWNGIQQFFTDMWDACKGAWEDACAWIQSIPDKVKGFFDGAGKWLWDAGKAILDGLLGGLKSAWDTVAGWVGSIGGWIQNLKGPIEYDRKLLIPAGKAIMGSLDTGLESGFKGVRTRLKSITREISGFDAQVMLDTKANVSARYRGLDSQLSGLIDVGSINRSNFTTADMAEAFSDAFGAQRGEISLYIDGKKVASTIAGPMDAELAVRAQRSNRR